MSLILETEDAYLIAVTTVHELRMRVILQVNDGIDPTENTLQEIEELMSAIIDYENEHYDDQLAK